VPPVLAEEFSKSRRDAAMGKCSQGVMRGYATALTECRCFGDADLFALRLRLMLHHGGAALP